MLWLAMTASSAAPSKCESDTDLHEPDKLNEPDESALDESALDECVVGGGASHASAAAAPPASTDLVV